MSVGSCHMPTYLLTRDGQVGPTAPLVTELWVRLYELLPAASCGHSVGHVKTRCSDRCCTVHGGSLDSALGGGQLLNTDADSAAFTVATRPGQRCGTAVPSFPVSVSLSQFTVWPQYK